MLSEPLVVVARAPADASWCTGTQRMPDGGRSHASAQRYESQNGGVSLFGSGSKMATIIRRLWN
jgi:hypothetical protein